MAGRMGWQPRAPLLPVESRDRSGDGAPDEIQSGGAVRDDRTLLARLPAGSAARGPARALAQVVRDLSVHEGPAGGGNRGVSQHRVCAVRAARRYQARIGTDAGSVPADARTLR